MTAPKAKRFSGYRRDPVRAMLVKASHGDSQDLESYIESGGDMSALDPDWLADTIKKMRLASTAETRGAARGPYLSRDERNHPDAEKRKRAKLCAAYLVRRCARRHRNWSGKPTPWEVLEKLEERALGVVHQHFGTKLATGSVVGAKGAKHTAYEKIPHDDIMLTVHSDLRKQMHDMLTWHAKTWFPTQPEA